MGDRVATIDGLDLTSARYQVLAAVGSNQSSAPATLSAVQAIAGIRLAHLEVLKLYNDAGSAKDVRVCFTIV